MKIILLALAITFSSSAPERHFFVGYIISLNDGSECKGNVQWHTYDGLMPIKSEVVKFLQKDSMLISYKFGENDVAIVGLYEFKSKSECEQFFKGITANKCPHNTDGKHHYYNLQKCNEANCGGWCKCGAFKKYKDNIWIIKKK